MGRITVRIDDNLEIRFRREIVSRYDGYYHGVIKKAMAEAIQLWIEQGEK